MREQKILAEPFEFLDILRCESEIHANDHGYMIIRGHIKADKEEEYINLLLQECWASVKACDENGKSADLFSGIVTESNIEVENGLKTLTLLLKTGSYLTDLTEHTRTFQNKEMPYDSVMEKVMESYPSGGRIMCVGNGKSIERFLCQYQETDWEFAKRMASYCNAFLMPNYIGKGEKIYFGLPEGVYRGNVYSTEYRINQTSDGISYTIKLRDIFDIGDIVTFLGIKFQVMSRRTILEAGELYHIYELNESGVLKSEPLYCHKLIGVSLSATVTDVETTYVQISIKEDENRASCGSKWFPFATVYSSSDGTGWYCMPETGDCVRVYFPSDREDDAYVLHSTHMTTQNSEERINPDYKSFMNKQGKEILLKPDSIVLTNNAGMSLEISDEEGISIVSDKKIMIQSKEAVEITSVNDRVDIIAPDRISLNQGKTKMVLSDRLTMRGAKIRLD